MTLGSILFSFQGRLNRQPFWLATLALIVVEAFDFAMMGVAAGSAGPDANPNPAAVILMLGCIALLFVCSWASLALSVKRMHDRNKSGWFVLISIVPLLNFWLFIESVLRGTVGPNRFGPDPLAAHEPTPRALSQEGQAG
jgi:uncharacterized membrane protein YhaH (DUF805 family)